MKAAIIVCFFAVAAVTLAHPHEATYTTAFDDLDLDEIFANDRLFDGYVKCICEEGNCTPAGKELKAHIQEALETECEKCTPAQRKGAERVIEFMILHKPEAWLKVKAKYDPTGKFVKKYEARIKAIESKANTKAN